MNEGEICDGRRRQVLGKKVRDIMGELVGFEIIDSKKEKRII